MCRARHTISGSVSRNAVAVVMVVKVVVVLIVLAAVVPVVLEVVR